MRDRRLALFLLVPSLAVTLAMALFPLGHTLWVSFRDWRLAKSPDPGPFVGWENYRLLLTDDPEFLAAVLVTAKFVVADVAATLVVAMAIALVVRRAGRLYALTRTLLVVPFVMSPALIGVSFRFMLNPEYGVWHRMIGALAPGARDTVWLADETWAMVALVAADVWHWAPYMALVLLGGLASVPRETVEAAQVDGASPARVFFTVVLPQMRPVIAVVLVLKTVFALKTFDMVYTLTRGGPGASTQTLAYQIYTTGFQFYDMGYAAAAAYLLTAVLLVLAGFYVRLMFAAERKAADA